MKCNQPLKAADVRTLMYNTDEDPEGAAAADLQTVMEAPQDSQGEAAKITKYGTKLTALVTKLLELREQDATAKAILFVQFDDLKMQVAAALRDCGVNTAQLKGSVSQRANIIRDWQENPDSKIFVLLLSLAESASGTNLTAGSHVIFLHPMLASTAERAAAQELQAIGRARRHGQKRDTLHVWRFVTDGTVEQAMTKRHEKTLLEHEKETEKRTAKAAPSAEDAQRAEKELRLQRQRAARAGIRLPKR